MRKYNDELTKKSLYGILNSSKKLMFISTQHANMLRELSERNLRNSNSNFFKGNTNINKPFYRRYSKRFIIEFVQKSNALRIPFSVKRGPKNDNPLKINIPMIIKSTKYKIYTPKILNHSNINSKANANKTNPFLYYPKGSSKNGILNGLINGFSRNNNISEFKTVPLSIIPNNYNVDDVMKDLINRKEKVMNIMHKAILIKNTPPHKINDIYMNK